MKHVSVFFWLAQFFFKSAFPLHPLSFLLSKKNGFLFSFFFFLHLPLTATHISLEAIVITNLQFGFDICINVNEIKLVLQDICKKADQVWTPGVLSGGHRNTSWGYIYNNQWGWRRRRQRWCKVIQDNTIQALKRRRPRVVPLNFTPQEKPGCQVSHSVHNLSTYLIFVTRRK